MSPATAQPKYTLVIGDTITKGLTRKQARDRLRKWIDTWGYSIHAVIRRDDGRRMSSLERQYFAGTGK